MSCVNQGEGLMLYCGYESRDRRESYIMLSALIEGLGNHGVLKEDPVAEGLLGRHVPTKSDSEELKEIGSWSVFQSELDKV